MNLDISLVEIYTDNIFCLFGKEEYEEYVISENKDILSGFIPYIGKYFKCKVE